MAPNATARRSNEGLVSNVATRRCNPMLKRHTGVLKLKTEVDSYGQVHTLAKRQGRDGIQCVLMLSALPEERKAPTLANKSFALPTTTKISAGSRTPCSRGEGEQLSYCIDYKTPSSAYHQVHGLIPDLDIQLRHTTTLVVVPIPCPPPSIVMPLLTSLHRIATQARLSLGHISTASIYELPLLAPKTKSDTSPCTIAGRFLGENQNPTTLASAALFLVAERVAPAIPLREGGPCIDLTNLVPL